jgi:hypothetical protein
MKKKESECETKLISGHGPHMEHDTKTNWPTDRPSQYKMNLDIRDCTANYRLILSSERAPYMKKKDSNCHSMKFKIWSSAPKGARYQGELVD